MASNNLYDDSIKILDKIVSLIHLDKETLKKLKEPHKIIEIDIPVKMDDGKIKKFKGFRVQHNNTLGPYKGGIRFHPQVCLEEVKSLAFWMMIKTAVADIPFGGGKGGVAVDAKSLSKRELEKLSRSYMRAIASHIGKHIDVPAPDVDTNPQIMAWMLDEYEKFVGYEEPAVITGKPLEKGGSKGREEATGLGGAILLKEIAKTLGKKPSETKVAVQGFGNVGYWFAKWAQNFGFKVVAVSDSKGGIYNPKGLDIDKVLLFKKEKGSLSGFAGGEEIKNNEVLELPVDVVVPAALEGAINEGNAERVKAPIILEMANGPLTKDADRVLSARRVMIVPDILANSGGVTVSYFEWHQNINKESWSVESVRSQLEKKIIVSWLEVLKKSKKMEITLRESAYVLALERLSIEIEK